jgi:hypothetical protein
MSRPCRIERDAKYAGMFRLAWPDGVLSAEAYNETSASV